MAETISVLLSEEEVDKRIKEMAEQITKDYEGKNVHLICILKGSVFFTCELAKRIKVPVSMDFMSVSSYGADTKSSGIIKIVKDLYYFLRQYDFLDISPLEKYIAAWRDTKGKEVLTKLESYKRVNA